jgi:hypothetical protein
VPSPVGDTASRQDSRYLLFSFLPTVIVNSTMTTTSHKNVFMFFNMDVYCLSIALKILRGESVPPAVYIDHTFITPENIDNLYPE